MKIKDPQSVSGIPGDNNQGGGFLSQFNETLKNLNLLVSSAKNFQGQAPTAPTSTERQIMRNTDGPPVKAIEAPKAPGEIAQLLQLAIAFGYGNKTIKELIELVGPFTINQIIDVLQKAVQRGTRPNK